MGSIPNKTTVWLSILLLISNAATFRRDKSMFFNRTFIVGSLYGLISIFQGLCISFLFTSLGLFGGLLRLDSTNQYFHSFLCFTAIMIVQLTAFHPRKIFSEFIDYPGVRFWWTIIQNRLVYFTKMVEHFKIIEYPLILLFIVLGGLFLMSCSDVVTIFLAIELQSFGLYILAAIFKNSEWSVSAALVYFLLGGLSSCFVLLSTSLLYSNSGTTLLDGHYIITGVSDVTEYFGINIWNLRNISYISTSLSIMSLGLLFKISAAPFHNWSPDVYDGIPTIVTTFISIIAKISILILLLQLTIFTSNLLINDKFNWSYSLYLSSILSFFVGTLLGLSQLRIKRLFAYSTISHVGFIILAIAINTMESIEAFMFYTFQYTLSNLNAFLILIAIGYSLYFLQYKNKSCKDIDSGDLPERSNSPVQLTTEIKGIYKNNPILSLSLSITLFSFVGIPPLMGFFAKQMVLSSAINGGYIFVVLVAIVTSVISASYYLNIVKEIFFQDNTLIKYQSTKYKLYKITLMSLVFNKFHNNKYTTYNICLSSFLTFNISILTLLILSFMFASQEWLNVTRLLSLTTLKM